MAGLTVSQQNIAQSITLPLPAWKKRLVSFTSPVSAHSVKAWLVYTVCVISAEQKKKITLCDMSRLLHKKAPKTA